MSGKWQVSSGLVAGPLFVAVFLLEGVLRPGYNPMRHPVSSLAIGPNGWVQSVTFVITSALLLAFTFGVRQRLSAPGDTRWGPRLIALCVLGLIGAGVFTTDAFNGYPPGTPPRPAAFSLHGTLHTVCAVE